MANKKWQVIALYSDGNARYQIGRLIDPAGRLQDGNVEWLPGTVNTPVVYYQYEAATEAAEEANAGNVKRRKQPA